MKKTKEDKDPSPHAPGVEDICNTPDPLISFLAMGHQNFALLNISYPLSEVFILFYSPIAL
jgi:hypothetical protein